MDPHPEADPSVDPSSGSNNFFLLGANSMVCSKWITRPRILPCYTEDLPIDTQCIKVLNTDKKIYSDFNSFRTGKRLQSGSLSPATSVFAYLPDKFHWLWMTQIYVCNRSAFCFAQIGEGSRVHISQILIFRLPDHDGGYLSVTIVIRLTGL